MSGYEEIMERHNLPPLEGTIVKMRCTFAGEDWWAKTEHGWFWLRGDALDRKWAPAPLGPPGEDP